MATDNDYIERLQRGDETCLQDIYIRYRREFTDWAERRYSLEPEEAKDMFQVVLISFYENVTSGRLKELSSSLRTYLFAIGKYKILKSQKNSLLYANLDEFEDINISEPESNEAELETESHAKVHQALQKLGGDCQKILELFYFQEQSMVSIAQILQYKNDNVAKVKKSNCMRKLASIFKSY